MTFVMSRQQQQQQNQKRSQQRLQRLQRSQQQQQSSFYKHHEQLLICIILLCCNTMMMKIGTVDAALSALASVIIPRPPPCKIDSLELWYSTAKYKPYLNSDIGIEDPFRSNPAEFGNGFLVCYEPNPLSIQVVPTLGCPISTSFDFKLSKNGIKIHRRKDIAPPYYMFADTVNVTSGRVLTEGYYELVITPNSTKVPVTSTFEVIDCGTSYTWVPPNQCNTCHPLTHTCMQSSCNKKDYLSFVLVLEGYTVTDMQMIITTPTGEVINYDTYESGSSPLGATKEGDGYDYNCYTCHKRWLKEISFPATAPKGEYQIQLQYVDWMMSYGDIVSTGPAFQFDVYMYNNTIVQSYPMGEQQLSFTLT
jgi:hypothetical protein